MRGFSHRFPLSALSIATLGLMTGCGGGGATTQPLRQSEPPQSYSTSSYINPYRVHVETTASGAPAGTVKVGVVDTGFLVDHFELKNSVLAAQDFGGSGHLADNVSPHGTSVAMVLAGKHVGYSANARLLLAKAVDSSGFIGLGNVSVGGQWALNQGARVLNFSLSPMYQHSGASTDALYGLAVQKDAVMTVVAGNGSANLTQQVASTADIFEHPHTAYKNITLVVGALSGDQRASYSNYPGESAVIQSRFLMADGTNPVQKRNASKPATWEGGPSWFGGTSSAAPVVAAAATSLRAWWPHLSATQTAQLLLDTADRSFTALYSQNTCGSNGSTNCGLYHFGQGRLDLDAAMQPVGSTVIPSGSQVQGASHAVQDSQLLLPAAFGDALQGQTASAALFDSYGRDFRFNALNLASVQGGAPLTASRLWRAAEPATQAQAGALQFSWQPRAADGSYPLTLDWQAPGHQLQFSHGPGAQTRSTPDTPPALQGLVGLQGSGPLGFYQRVSRMAVQSSRAQGWNWHASVSLARGHAGSAARADASTPAQGRTRAQPLRQTQTDQQTPQAQRHELGLDWPAGPTGQMRIGYALTTEHRGLLGGSGQAAMGLSRSWHQAMSLEWSDRAPLSWAPGWRALARVEVGQLKAQGQALIARMDGARTSELMLGLMHESADSRWAFSINQPLRVDRARLHLDLPVGRTLDGQVLRRQQTLNLAPKGRQLNLEMAYHKRLDAHSTLQLQALHATDYGHVRALRQWAVSAQYRVQW